MQQPVLRVEAPLVKAAAVVMLPDVRPDDPYEGLLFDIETQRVRLAARHEAGKDVLDTARRALRGRVADLVEHWVGTPYAFHGVTEVPGTGAIACGHFVATVLDHAGFHIELELLGEQASEWIVLTLVPDHEVRRFRSSTTGSTRASIVDWVEQAGPSVHLVGLDTHVGLLRYDGRGEVELCHATPRQDQGVICEPAATSPSLVSRYTVVGRLDNADAAEAWLTGASLATAGQSEPEEPVEPAEASAAMPRMRGGSGSPSM